MIDCTALLSAAAVLSKLLFAGSRRSQKIVSRCKRLRELLSINDGELPVLRNLSVRNGFEHVDERLDAVLPSFSKGAFSPVSVHEKQPDAKIVLKRFDPRNLTISFADAKISLAECMIEISQIETNMDEAFRKLHGPEFKLWPPFSSAKLVAPRSTNMALRRNRDLAKTDP